MLSVGASWSISQAKVYQLELAEYKLAVGGALNKVQKVSDTLEKSAQRLPIASPKREEIKQQIKESNAAIQQAQSEIDVEIEQLTEKDESNWKARGS